MVGFIKVISDSKKLRKFQYKLSKKVFWALIVALVLICFLFFQAGVYLGANISERIAKRQLNESITRLESRCIFINFNRGMNPDGR